MNLSSMLMKGQRPYPPGEEGSGSRESSEEKRIGQRSPDMEERRDHRPSAPTLH